MRFTLSIRALLGAAAAPLLFAAVMFTVVAPNANETSAAGDCTADPSLDSEELAFLTLINNHRAANGLGPLAPSYTLSKAAQWKSNDMGVNAYFAHDDLFRGWVQRLRDCGHTANAWLGENIAGGTQTAQEAFNIWKNSPGHNANMLFEHYTGIGIGRAYVPGSPWGWYWTTDFTSVNDPFPPGNPTATPTRTPTRTNTPIAATSTPTRTSTPVAATSTPTRTNTPSIATSTPSRTNTPVAATSTPTRTSTPVAPTSTPAAAAAIHIGDIDGWATTGEPRWTPNVMVRVRNSSNLPVAGVTVSGTWGGKKGASSCVTDTAGACTIVGPAQRNNAPSATFTVTGASKSGIVYQASANTDPDGDSNGTTIVVAR